MKLKKSYILVMIIIMMLLLFIMIKIPFDRKLENLHYESKPLISVNASPNQKYAMIFYLSEGGSLSNDGVIGVLENREQEEKHVIFFSYPCSDVIVKWIDNKTIETKWINTYDYTEKKKILNVEQDTYDWRK